MKRSLTYRGFFPDALSLDAGFSQTLFLRGALAAGVLAIIAGIFGMHVMTGNHAAHGDHAAGLQAERGHTGHTDAVDADADHAAVGHPLVGHPLVGHTLVGHTDAGHAVAAGITSCAGSCHRVHEPGTSCVPSAKASALAVFPPHENGLVFPAAQGGRTGRGVNHVHIPPSPTPCELSISRT
ncbi:hypothetical protein [Pseudarthrobacter sulfonivorans]|uniref:hypothetical protein n=1 Tax=Pseudarthrobacter sulfonivorans TaxID=121292 RepID=UPI00168A561B|nr:hypothetical protein [Pseudarthrobacter sulfonivorans]